MGYELLTSATPGNSDVLKTVSVLTGATSDWIVFPQGISKVSAILLPAGTASVQYTNDLAGVIAGTATGITWDDGVVAVNTGRVAEGVCAFRVVSAAGAATAYFRGLFE